MQTSAGERFSVDGAGNNHVPRWTK